MRRVRVGGVPEHFNLPWRLAIDEGAFDVLGVELDWIDFPGGTGEIMAALADGTIDVATPLTEGVVTAIANGNRSRVIRVWVRSPLLWGVHVAAGSHYRSIDELDGGRFAISRFGSGSELMSRVLAEDRHWTLRDDSWVVVGDLDGALAALPAGKAEIFLWNKSMTQPYVDDGTFRRVSVVPTPWPSFVVAASDALVSGDRGLARSIADIASARAGAVKIDSGSAALVSERYGLATVDAVGFLEHVEWNEPGREVDVEMIQSVIDRMRALGRIDQAVAPSDIVA